MQRRVTRRTVREKLADVRRILKRVHFLAKEVIMACALETICQHFARFTLYLHVTGYFFVLFCVSSAPEHSARCVPLDDEWRKKDSICPDPSTFHPFLSGGRRERQKLWQNLVHLHEGILGLTCFKNSKLIISDTEYFISLILKKI